jgi:hypothetical protein
MDRPLLLLDIDGVLNPWAATTLPEGFAKYVLFPADEEPHRFAAHHGEWIRELARSFDVVWASAWGSVANRLLAPILGLPEFPWVPFPPTPFPPVTKVPSIAEYVDERAVAWVDDGDGTRCLGVGVRAASSDAAGPRRPRRRFRPRARGRAERMAERARRLSTAARSWSEPLVDRPARALPAGHFANHRIVFAAEPFSSRCGGGLLGCLVVVDPAARPGDLRDLDVVAVWVRHGPEESERLGFHGPGSR